MLFIYFPRYNFISSAENSFLYFNMVLKTCSISYSMRSQDIVRKLKLFIRTRDWLCTFPDGIAGCRSMWVQILQMCSSVCGQTWSFIPLRSRRGWHFMKNNQVLVKFSRLPRWALPDHLTLHLRAVTH